MLSRKSGGREKNVKKIIAITMAFLLLLSVSVCADTVPSDWAKNEIMPQLPSLFESVVGSVDYQRALTRSEACMILFQVYTKLGGDISANDVKQKFADVGSEISDMFIPFMYEAKVVYGISDTEFAPRAHVKRQELCTMLCRVLEQFDVSAKTEIASAGGNISAFDDSNDVAAWATNNVGYCIDHGYIKGVSETVLNPLGDVSVEQAMVICSRIVNERLDK